MQEGEEREISDLIQRVFGEFVAPAYVPEGVNYFLDYVRPAAIGTRNRDGRHVALCAKIDHRIIGVIEIRSWNHICLLFVDKRHHKKGISRKLLQESIHLCRAKGSEWIDVNSSPFAVPVYERLGFVQTDAEQLRNGIRFVPMKIKL